jgi:hypothetical protein
MLGLAKRLKCPILQTSTSEAYGDRPSNRRSNPKGAKPTKARDVIFGSSAPASCATPMLWR